MRKEQIQRFKRHILFIVEAEIGIAAQECKKEIFKQEDEIPVTKILNMLCKRIIERIEEKSNKLAEVAREQCNS